MKNSDKLGEIFNVILGLTYIPLSLFSWLMQMASENAMEATNPTYITLIDIFCIISAIIPLLCILGIGLSVRYRRKGHSTFSFVIQFVPLLIFILNLILLWVAESIPPMSL